MTIIATFKGQDGSLGYNNGHVYTLKLVGPNTIQRMDGSGRCAYRSLETFLSNWNYVKDVTL
jgi:hypothetical protein